MIKILDRILLFLCSLVIGILSIGLLALSFQWIKLPNVETVLDSFYRDMIARSTFIALSILFLLISIRFLYVSVRKAGPDVSSIDQRTDFGDIRISLETIENLSLKSTSRVRGVKDLKARVTVNDAGLEILIRTIVDGEISIPHLTEEIQRSVKGHVEEVTGIPVASVSVYVANINHSPSFKSRVE
ncbi:alkaline shock response membrane anchor protein AmaP [Ferviditalea candida]|uniref:Alkaline shock response membrane anchor protein AmaP n=1 Tax=Ferviditalea candida TaxID=3108399 RepID=A0ABU5ZG09_9BACL|nr:alkaline shock response membrane anchor protein AmaP [Paenibacillaceae bacterium T2]